MVNEKHADCQAKTEMSGFGEREELFPGFFFSKHGNAGKKPVSKC